MKWKDNYLNERIIYKEEILEKMKINWENYEEN